MARAVGHRVGVRGSSARLASRSARASLDVARRRAREQVAPRGLVSARFLRERAFGLRHHEATTVRSDALDLEKDAGTMPRFDAPFTGADVRRDAVSGFLVFLIALPLSLGIAMASGFPPVAGILTAIIGGVVVSVLGSARLTIKGPAAGLIVIALGAVQELGAGDAELGYRRALAVGVVAGVVQIALALMRAGFIRELMPPSVVHGMLAAIGVIIVSKQAHTTLGAAPQATDPLGLIAELPHSLAHANPEIVVIGGLSLLITFGLPLVRAPWAHRLPAALVVLLVAVPLGLAFDLDHQHTYTFADHEFAVGPQYLVTLPGNLLTAMKPPDFSVIGSGTAIKYIVMFALVGTIESLLSVRAVDSLDPHKRTSNANRDLFAVGAGNTLAGAIGGLPMISEIVRSKANIDGGATSPLSNVFHGLFLVVLVVAAPGLLHQIPLAALAALLVFTGLRLASPADLRRAWSIGPIQLLLFVTTLVVTLTTDLLVGVAAGIALKLVLHVASGVPVRHLFTAPIVERREGDRLILEVHGAVFTNYLGLERRLAAIDEGVQAVEIDLSNAWVVDHTVLEKLCIASREWAAPTLALRGLEGHHPRTSHPLAVRIKRRAP
jgi:MFS superfamily sulfate permease-like transporter